MKKLMVLAAFALLNLSACAATASLVRSAPASGQIRLQGPYMAAMGKARMVMVEHCHGRFDYRELGEAVEFQCRQRPVSAEPAAADLELASIAASIR